MTLLTLNHVSYVNEKGKQLLEDISFGLNAGEITTVIGPNGAGKTTLLRVVLGLLKQTQGTIDRSKDLVVGYMPQRLQLNQYLPMTVFSFLTLSLKECKNLFYISRLSSRVHEVLEYLNLSHLTQMNVHYLSGGEWQRVLLARALLQMPQLLILDEPVQGLDVSGQSEFYEILKRIRNDHACAVLHVSHDLHLVWDASDHVICLNKHICCSGVPSVVRNNPDVQKLFGAFLPYAHTHDHCHDGLTHSHCAHHNHVKDN